MGSHKLSEGNRLLASSSDFVIVHKIPTKLLRYGLLDRDLDAQTPLNHSSSPHSNTPSLSHLIKSKTMSSLADDRHSDSRKAADKSNATATPHNSKCVPAATTAAHSLRNILILVIPGNPGVIDYYEVFMQTLYVRLNQIIPVWGISHAGHVRPPNIYSHLFDTASSDEAAADIYNLEGQIRHKMEFLRRYVPPTTRLILLGHSIGAYIAVELMHRLSTAPQSPSHHRARPHHVILAVCLWGTM